MELAEWFLVGLKQYDERLSAIFDDHQGEIHLYYTKSGQKSLAYSDSRQHAELYPEWQRRILKELPLKDVLKRHGSGEAYDDYLDKMDRERRESKQRQLDDDRMQKMKDDKWLIKGALENAAAGRFTKEKARPFEIPSVSIPKSIPKEGESESL